MNGDRIKLARKRAGLSLRGLADEMDGIVSAQAVGKYERDEMTPSSEVLIALTRALGVSVSYLMAPQEIELGEVEFRTKASTTKRDRAKVETDVLEAVERYLQIEQILELQSAEWNCPKHFPRHVSKPEQAENLANELREAWGLGTDPIPNMTQLLEEKGIKVLLEDLPEKVSGFTCLVRRDGQPDVPVVVVNRNHSLERRRLTLAHELGHRVIKPKRGDKSNVEKWCNRFAGAFLITKSHLQSEIGKCRTAIGYRELVGLKRLYRVSAAALLVRLEQIGVINRNALEYAFRTFARTWRRTEPNPLEGDKPATLEKPHRFIRLVYRALAEDLIAIAKAAELLRRSIGAVEEGLRGPAHADHR